MPFPTILFDICQTLSFAIVIAVIMFEAGGLQYV